MSNKKCFDQFNAQVNVIKTYCGTPQVHPDLTNYILVEMLGLDISTYPSRVTSDQNKAAKKTARNTWHVFLLVVTAM